MKLHFYGADRCVTGSCHCLEINGKKILVDCGLQQGRDELDNRYLAFAPGNIDILLVTHAHIDHPGREGGRLCCVQRPDDEGRAAEVGQQLIGAEPHRPPRRHDDAAHRRVFCVLHPADLPKFPLLFVAELMLSDGSIIADFVIK